MTGNILLFAFGAPQLILIVLVLLLIFGGKKIPVLMRGLGKGVSSFKKGLKDVDDEIKNDLKDDIEK